MHVEHLIHCQSFNWPITRFLQSVQSINKSHCTAHMIHTLEKLKFGLREMYETILLARLFISFFLCMRGAKKCSNAVIKKNKVPQQHARANITKSKDTSCATRWCAFWFQLCLRLSRFFLRSYECPFRVTPFEPNFFPAHKLQTLQIH